MRLTIPRLIALAGVLTVAAACKSGSTSPAAGGTATLVDSAGRTVGAATFRTTKAGVAIDLNVTGLTPGEHGIHLHTVGKCDPPGFTTAGGHFNPGSMHHGLRATGGPHAGDLPNLTATAAGSAHYTTTTTRITLGEGATSLFDADGSAIVIHAAQDDNMTDPSGNSGARLVCGVIMRAK